MFTFKIESYQLPKPIAEVFLWGARGVINTPRGEKRTIEVWGRSKEEAEEKVKRRMAELEQYQQIFASGKSNPHKKKMRKGRPLVSSDC